VISHGHVTKTQLVYGGGGNIGLFVARWHGNKFHRIHVSTTLPSTFSFARSSPASKVDREREREREKQRRSGPTAPYTGGVRCKISRNVWTEIIFETFRGIFPKKSRCFTKKVRKYIKSVGEPVK